jgi:hypothetical protein
MGKRHIVCDPMHEVTVHETLLDWSRLSGHSSGPPGIIVSLIPILRGFSRTDVCVPELAVIIISASVVFVVLYNRIIRCRNTSVWGQMTARQVCRPPGRPDQLEREGSCSELTRTDSGFTLLNESLNAI